MENFTNRNQSEKLPKMKVFQIIQKNFATIGISPNLATPAHPFNGRIFVGLFILGSSIICNLIHMFYTAKSFADYTKSIIINSDTTLIIFALLIIVFNSEKLFKFINACNDAVNTSA